MELLKALAESLYAAAATDTSSSKACASLIARAMAMYALSSIIRFAEAEGISVLDLTPVNIDRG